MTRQQRQVDQLTALCASGQVARAIDLAFEHFATFGRDERIVVLLDQALEPEPGDERIRRRLDELHAGGQAPATRSGPYRAT